MATERKQVCFVISPIGREGSEIFNRFKEVLDYVIRPAVAQSGFKLEVLRADDIERPGSFIRDILEQLLQAYVVIADLTTQNPNVFYELGVRHALSPRTILIAQSVDDIPSDIRDYRTIVYDTSARGATIFAERFAKFLADIDAAPQRSDNPVLDRVGGIMERQTATLQQQVQDLKSELDSLLRKGTVPTPATNERRPSVSVRVNRILKLHGAERQWLTGEITYTKGGKNSSVRLPAEQGEFKLYFLGDDSTVSGCLYLATAFKANQLEELMADVRVLLGPHLKSLETGCTFVIASNADFSKVKADIAETFRTMKKYAPATVRRLLNIDIWDDSRITELEQELGIRIAKPVAS